MESVKTSLRRFFLENDTGEVGSRCKLCLAGSRARGRKKKGLREEVVVVFQRSLSLEPEAKRLWVCGECEASLVNLSKLFFQLEDLRTQFNELRRKVAKDVVVRSLGRSRKEWECFFEEEIKPAEDFYPSVNHSSRKEISNLNERKREICLPDFTLSEANNTDAALLLELYESQVRKKEWNALWVEEAEEKDPFSDLNDAGRSLTWYKHESEASFELQGPQVQDTSNAEIEEEIQDLLNPQHEANEEDEDVDLNSSCDGRSSTASFSLEGYKDDIEEADGEETERDDLSDHSDWEPELLSKRRKLPQGFRLVYSDDDESYSISLESSPSANKRNQMFTRPEIIPEVFRKSRRALLKEVNYLKTKSKPDNGNGLKCFFCEKTFLYNCHAARHVRKCHKRTCKMMTPNKSLPMNIRPAAEKKVVERRVKSRLKCFYCEETFAFNSGRTRHIKNFHKGKPHEVEVGFSKKKTFSCSVCSKVFYNKQGAWRCKSTHNGPYDCNKCNSSFSSSGERNHHIRKFHYKIKSGSSSSKTFLCSVCLKLHNSKREVWRCKNNQRSRRTII